MSNLENYRTKSDAELRFIIRDAGETALLQRGMSSESKYLDQVNDASTVLSERLKARQVILTDNQILDEFEKRNMVLRTTDGTPNLNGVRVIEGVCALLEKVR
jgi:hypothetical protein